MPRWTSASEVRILVKAGTQLTNAEITHILNNCEGYLVALLKLGDGFTYNANSYEHLLLREAATLRAALEIISSTPMSLRTIDEASMALDVYRDLYADCLALLNDQSVSTNIIRDAG